MLPVLSLCFGHVKVEQRKVTPNDVTKVNSGASKSKVVKSFEAELVKGAESRDIHRLERAVNEATSSGLLSQSSVLSTERSRLQKWKSATVNLQSLLRSYDVDKLQSAIADYKELGLKDPENLLESATTALHIAQKKRMLQECIERRDIHDLEAAIFSCEALLTNSKDATALAQDVEEARSVLLSLHQEQKRLVENPKFPLEELEKAISLEKIRLLRASLERWERLKSDQKNSVYLHAKRSYQCNPGLANCEAEPETFCLMARSQQNLFLPLSRRVAREGVAYMTLTPAALIRPYSVLQERLIAKQAKVIARLEKIITQRDIKAARNLLAKAKSYEVPQPTVAAIENHVICPLERSVAHADDVIRALADKQYAKLGQTVNELNEEPRSAKERAKSSKKLPKMAGDVEVKVTLMRDVIQDQNRLMTRLTQNVIRPYRVSASAVGAVEIRAREAARQLYELAEKHRGSGNSDVSESRESFGCLREDLDQTLGRPAMLSELHAFLAEATEKLAKTLAVARGSLDGVNNAAKQSLEKLRAMQTGDAACPSETSCFQTDAESINAGFPVVQEASFVLEVFNRYSALVGAEKTLALFLGNDESKQTSPNEAEKAAANLEAALKVFSCSTTPNGDTYIDLCYNRPKEFDKMASARQRFEYLNRILDCLARLFPEKLFGNLKRAAGVRLAEIRISRMESNSSDNAARYDLHRAVLSDNETEISKALNTTRLSKRDRAVVEAETHLNELKDRKRTCIDALRKAVAESDEASIEACLSLSEKLFVSPVHAVVLEAKQKLGDMKFQSIRRENAVQGLALALESTDAKALRESLARAHSCRVPVSEPMLTRARESIDQFVKKVEESAQLRHRNVEIAAKVINGNFSQGDAPPGEHPWAESKLTLALSGRTKSASSSLTDCLLAEMENVERLRDVDNSTKVITKIIRLSSEEDKISTDLTENAERILEKVQEKRNFAEKMRKKLTSAVALNSSEELTTSISQAESSSDVVDYLSSSQCDDFFRALSDAREALALLQERRKNEDEDLKLRQIAAARHQLKKALLTEDTNSQPLREAVNAFRMVCLPETDKSLLDEVEKRSGGGKEKGDKRGAVERRKSGRRERNREVSRRSQTARQERPSSKPRQPSRPKSARPDVSETNINRVSKPATAWVTPRSTKNSARTSNIPAINSSSDQKVVKTVRFELPNNGVKSRRRPTNNPRPHSASENTPKAGAPRTRQAWGAQDSRNIALLRKAEKNLQRVEMLEVKQKLEEESNELWRKLKQGMMGKLKESIESGDRADLWQALCEFERYFGDGELNNDEKMLLSTAKELLRKRTASQYADNLKNALKQREIETLEHLLYQIENESEDHLPDIDRESFWSDVRKAKELIKQLGDLSRYRSAILAMSRQLVSEIHSFQSPPDVVKAAILATFMLLGENERKINDWPALHALMGKLGRLSVTRRVALCDPSSVPVATARRVLLVLRDVTYDRILKINKGACTFYCWANCMAHEVLARKSDGESQTPVKTSPKEKLLPKRIDIEFWSRLARPTDRRSAEQSFREKMSSRNRATRVKSAVTVKTDV